MNTRYFGFPLWGLLLAGWVGYRLSTGQRIIPGIVGLGELGVGDVGAYPSLSAHAPGHAPHGAARSRGRLPYGIRAMDN